MSYLTVDFLTLQIVTLHQDSYKKLISLHFYTERGEMSKRIVPIQFYMKWGESCANFLSHISPQSK